MGADLSAKSNFNTEGEDATTEFILSKYDETYHSFLHDICVSSPFYYGI